MKDWRKMDRARKIIARAAREYCTWRKANPYRPGTGDWESYELGQRDAALDEFAADFAAEKNRLQTRILELE